MYGKSRTSSRSSLSFLSHGWLLLRSSINRFTHHLKLTCILLRWFRLTNAFKNFWGMTLIFLSGWVKTGHFAREPLLMTFSCGMRHETCSCLLCHIFCSLFQNCFQAKPFANQLLDNTQGVAGSPGVRVAPGRSGLEQNLAEIVIHTTAVLQCINQMTVCEPLRLLMDNPAALMVRLRKQCQCFVFA